MALSQDTNHQLTRICPAIGGNRHNSEDSRAVDEPVIWLSNTRMLYEPSTKYRFEVEIPRSDPFLFIDEPFAKLRENYSMLFKDKHNLRWHFCTREKNNSLQGL